MKNFKKTVSIISTLAMSMSVMGAVTAVHAEDAEIYGWSRYTANTETSAANVVESGAIGETTVTPSSGSRMLEMKVGNNEAQCIYVPDKLPAGAYTVSFDVIDPTKVEWRGYAKLGFRYLGTSSPNGCFARIGEAYKGTRTVLENGWTRFSDTYTLTSDTDGVWDGKTNNFVIGLLDNTNASAVIYIDNVSVKDADGNEYVKNGGFELDPPAPEPEPGAINEEITGWARMAENTATESSNIVTAGTINSAAVTPTSGSHMLEIKSGEQTANYVYVPQKLDTGIYTVSFKVCYPSGKSVEWAAYARLGTKTMGTDTSGKFARIGNENTGSAENLGNGWTKFSQTFEVAGTTDGVMYGTNNLIIGFDTATNSNKVMYVDEVSVKDANGTEYVTNGDFEDVAPMAFSSFTLSIDGVETETLSNGNATARVTVKNNNAESKNAQIIVASYGADDSLINVVTSEVKTIPSGETKVVYTTLPVTVGDDVAAVKVFLWDSLDEMTPLKDMQKYSK